MICDGGVFIKCFRELRFDFNTKVFFVQPDVTVFHSDSKKNCWVSVTIIRQSRGSLTEMR